MAAAAAQRCGVSLSKYTEAALRVFHGVATPELFAVPLVIAETLPPASKEKIAAAALAMSSPPVVVPDLADPPAATAMEPELEARAGVLHPGGRPPLAPPPATCRLCRTELMPAAAARGDELCAGCCTRAEDNPGVEDVEDGVRHGDDGYRVVYDDGA